ncbi:hypothetical protein [Nonomuraea sp. NPDC050202]|uniref:hypothetical protein n=1 Tax=Nonomuraea sp. NPDC050202 TaxID=3155035 RepID=UPI0033F61051
MPTITRPARSTPAEAPAVAPTRALPALVRGVVMPRPPRVRPAALTGAGRHAIGLLGRLRGGGPAAVRLGHPAGRTPA